jgi:hypothetical protein
MKTAHLSRLPHLTRRFFGSLRPGPPCAADTAWVETVLVPGEYELWSRMPNADRRHSIGVARRVQEALAGTAYADDSRWVAAALLHDVGKIDAGLNTFQRVGATLAGAAAGHDMAEAWAAKRGITRRVGLYLQHPELGATRIRLAGGRAEVAAWAEAHHQPERWVGTGIPEPVITALHDADDD